MIQKRLLPVTAVTVLLLLLPPGPSALAAQEARLFNDVVPAIQPDARLFDDPVVLRTRLVSVNLALVAGQPSGPQATVTRSLSLNLFDDAQFEASLDRVDVHGGADYSWVGHVDGHRLSSVTLAVGGGVMVGNVSVPGVGDYQIRYVGQGVHVIREVDYSAYPPEAEPRSVTMPTLDVPPIAMSDDGSRIDVLVVYTPQARTAAGGTTAVQNLIHLAVSETNTSYSNSGIHQRLRLVHREEVSYTESGDMATDLTRLTETADGYIDHVHNLRNTYGADEVVFLVESTQYCGIAWFMDPVSSGFAPYAFAVVARDCATGYYSFGHEMGHNMAARHDWYADSEDTPFTYNHGYLNLTDGWRTIMAYNYSGCPFGYCARIPYWSNPDVLYGGDPMGTPEGQPSPTDNRKTLNNTASTVANFRQALVEQMVLGVGSGGGGWSESLDGAYPHDSSAWIRSSWTAYNSAVGETRPVFCDVDGDSKKELVLGLGSYPSSGGWVEVKNDEDAGYAHLAWLRVDWSSYNSMNGETFPACGDLDGDGRDEIVVGLGNGGGGWVKAFDDASASYTALPNTPYAGGWIKVNWSSYNSARGEVHPVVGDLDADSREELVLGLGQGSSGWVQILDDAVAGFTAVSRTPCAVGWLQLSYNTYNLANGETWPAVGDMDNDGDEELVLGVGQGGGGWLQVRGDSSTSFAPVAGTPSSNGFLRVTWNAYNTAVGAAFPAVGDVDQDGREELVIGLGSYPTNGGWAEVREDLVGGLASDSWARLHWSVYNSANGLTRPAVK